MKSTKVKFIIDYINQLYKEIEDINNSFFLDNYDDLYETIREIVKLFQDEIPTLKDQLTWKNGAGYSDANLIIANLKKYLIDNGMITKVDLNIDRFWNRFKTWYNREVYTEKYLKPEYLTDDINSAELIPHICYEQEYLAEYGIQYPLSLQYEIYDFQDIVLFLEIIYRKWIVPTKRYDFTIYVNKLFSESGLPYQLKSGKILLKGYISLNDDVIINQKMFEDKLDYSRQLIVKNDIRDKKIALKLIMDCIEYLESIQPKKTKQRDELAKLVCSNTDSKMIKIVKDDLNSIFSMSNDYFDIRHNKATTNQGELREVLEDSVIVEYIYNRIYATIQLLSMKIKEKINE